MNKKGDIKHLKTCSSPYQADLIGGQQEKRTYQVIAKNVPFVYNKIKDEYMNKKTIL